jgi:hypothetical protein
VADGGGPAGCNGHCRARRLWERAGVRGLPLLPGHAHAGMLDGAEVRQRGVGGSGCVLPLLFHVSRPGSGQRGMGIDNQVREGVHGYGYRARAYGDGVSHSSLGFTEIRSPSVRSKARMKLNFENLKSATVGCQDTS